MVVQLLVRKEYFVHYPARACASRGYVIGCGVHVYIYIYIYMFVDEKNI